MLPSLSLLQARTMLNELLCAGIPMSYQWDNHEYMPVNKFYVERKMLMVELRAGLIQTQVFIDRVFIEWRGIHLKVLLIIDQGFVIPVHHGFGKKYEFWEYTPIQWSQMVENMVTRDGTKMIVNIEHHPDWECTAYIRDLDKDSTDVNSDCITEELHEKEEFVLEPYYLTLRIKRIKDED